MFTRSLVSSVCTSGFLRIQHTGERVWFTRWFINCIIWYVIVTTMTCHIFYLSGRKNRPPLFINKDSRNYLQLLGFCVSLVGQEFGRFFSVHGFIDSNLFDDFLLAQPELFFILRIYRQQFVRWFSARSTWIIFLFIQIVLYRQQFVRWFSARSTWIIFYLFKLSWSWNEL